MPKKRNKSMAGASSASATRNWSKVKSGGAAFREHSVPVNTPHRKVHNPGPIKGGGRSAC